ncbi:FAD-binding oxidoreductase [Nocardioides korecus]
MTREMHPQRWGDPRAAGPLPDSTQALVDAAFTPTPRPAVEDVVLPDSALPEEVLVSLRRTVGEEHVRTDDATRRLRTRGKSTPDLLRARSGDLRDAPDAVVRPGSHDEVVAVLAWAQEHGVAVVPFGGGTAVTGGLVAAREGYAGVVSLDLARMNGLLAVDATSMTATLQPGMRGPEAEAALVEHGFTLGHFPQSFEFASIGGFAATRSSGQNSAGFGRFDQMVVGLRAATPVGEIVTGAAPADAAGPDLRQLLLGSEGAFGVITEVTVRVRRAPAEQVHEAWQFESFAAGRDAMRDLAQRQLLPTILRLSDENETAVNLASQSDVGGETTSGVLMIVGFEGDAVQVRRDQVSGALTALGGTPLGEDRGRHWFEGRFAAPYLRDSMLDAGVLVETLETATFWSNVQRLHTDVSAALTESLGESALVLCHVSHVYETGCSLYFTVAAPQGDDPVTQWLQAKAAANEAILGAGATITHHHAVGTDHRDWFARQVGPVGVTVLRAVKAALDPAGILNPGVLVP